MLRRSVAQGSAACRTLCSGSCLASIARAATLSQRCIATTSTAQHEVYRREEPSAANRYRTPRPMRNPNKGVRRPEQMPAPTRTSRVPRSWPQRPGKAEDDPSLTQQLTPKELVVAMRNRAAKYLADPKTAGRVVGWGIAGRGLEVLASSIVESEATRKSWRSNEDVMTDLLIQWWDEAIEPMSQAILQNSSNEFWNGTMLRHVQREHLDTEVPRQCTASMLSWLEEKLLKATPTDVPADDDMTYLLTHIRALRKLTDMRFPSLLANNARAMVRNIHLHVGPTNSGKTHGALVALCKARTGLYAGPLRLLAHEVWDRINAGAVSPGVPPRTCNLLTGEEARVVDPDAGLQSCTVEMVNPESILDVAVLDEIQMIADPQRGYAWTSVVLGLGAKELHLCGENSVVPLIKRMAEACGDKVHVHEYERLTPLQVGESVEAWSNIRKGDCVVSFSRSGIFRLKETIERVTGLKCAVAYGALPPETKAEQAKLFNDPTNDVDVMVASDAIGMGLNLKIKRVIFSEVTKWNGGATVPISYSQMKQIAGRAGRYGTGQGDAGDALGGIATTFKKEDLQTLKDALAAPLKQITRACIELEQGRFEKLSTALPTLKASRPGGLIPGGSAEQSLVTMQPRSLKALYEDASLLMRIDTSMYFSSSSEQQSELAQSIEASLPHSANLTLHERGQFANSPTNTRDEKLMVMLGNMVRQYARGRLIPFELVEKGLDLLNALRDVEAAEQQERSHRKAMGEEVLTRTPEDDEEARVNLEVHRSLYDGPTPNSSVRSSSMDLRPEWSRPAATQEMSRSSTDVFKPTRPVAPGRADANVALDITTLMSLETLHRGLTLYSWLSMRFPVAFCFGEQVAGLSRRTEHAIHFCLESIRNNRKKRLEALGRDPIRPSPRYLVRQNDRAQGPYDKRRSSYGSGGAKRFGTDGYDGVRHGTLRG